MGTGSKKLVDVAQVEEARPTAVERCQRELKECRTRAEQR